MDSKMRPLAHHGWGVTLQIPPRIPNVGGTMMETPLTSWMCEQIVVDDERVTAGISLKRGEILGWYRPSVSGHWTSLMEASVSGGNVVLTNMGRIRACKNIQKGDEIFLCV
jgi:hypothetical protein